MTIFKRAYVERRSVRESLSTEEYLEKRGIFEDSIKVRIYEDNQVGVEEYLEKHGIDKDALRTLEGRKGAKLKHRLIARMIILCSLMAPMIFIPFWLMWTLSPINAKQYSERMQGAFLAALASDVIGLCWIVTRDLFPQGKESYRKQDNESSDNE